MTAETEAFILLLDNKLGSEIQRRTPHLAGGAAVQSLRSVI